MKLVMLASVNEGEMWFLTESMKVCSSGRQGHGIGSSRNCYFGSRKVIYAIYMENGCNDGELASWRLNFDDPGNSVRSVYCQELRMTGGIMGRGRGKGEGGGQSTVREYEGLGRGRRRVQTEEVD